MNEQCYHYYYNFATLHLLILKLAALDTFKFYIALTSSDIFLNGNNVAPGRGAKYCDQRVYMFVCFLLCFCVSARISQKSQVQISPNFLFMLPVAVARFFSDGNAIRYVLPVLWMTSCFHIMDRIGANQRRRVCFARWRHRERRLPSPTASCWYF